MNDPSSPQSSDQPSPAADRPRAGIAETLRHALRSLSGDRSNAPSGGLSPEALTELAQRAGLNSPGQVAELARMMGMEPSTTSRKRCTKNPGTRPERQRIGCGTSRWLMRMVSRCCRKTCTVGQIS